MCIRDRDLTIGPIPVTDQVAGNLFPTACFRDLICDPFCSGVSCDAKPQNLSSAVDMTNLHRSPPMNQSETDLGIVNESQLLRFGIRSAERSTSSANDEVMCIVSF